MSSPRLSTLSQACCRHMIFLVLLLSAAPPLTQGENTGGTGTPAATEAKEVTVLVAAAPFPLDTPFPLDPQFRPADKAAAIQEAQICRPWPDCVAAWFEDAVKERSNAGPLAQTMAAVTQGRATNCTFTAQCTPEKRIEEIDAILVGVQKKWEENAGHALASRSKVEDNLWKRWIKEAQDRVKDMERLARLRAEGYAVLSDIWLRRMSALSLNAALIKTSATSSGGAPLTSEPSGRDVLEANGTRQTASPPEGWERGGALRNAALSDSWRVSTATTPNVTRSGALASIESAAMCMLRELLDMALEEGDAVHAACPPNGKGDCFERCRRFCKVKAECRVFAVLASSCVISASLTNLQIAPLLVRMPGAYVGYVPMPTNTLPALAEGKLRDKKLPEYFKKMLRQAPHSQSHKLCVIVPFRDGCSAMSQGAGRRENLLEFVSFMPSFLDVVGVSSFRVIVVEQTQRGHWNKGILFNRGVLYAESIACDYVVMNDVDQIPVSDAIKHEWPKEPMHLCTNTDQAGFQFYDAMVGGAFLLQIEHYKKINGYSNKYFGWGQEDDDMYERVRFVYKEVKHMDQKVGKYHALKHGRVKDLDNTELFRNNSRYLDKLRNKGSLVYMADGYKNVLQLTSLQNVWKGPSNEIASDMSVVADGDYDHILVDALDVATGKSFAACTNALDAHAAIASH